MRPTRGGGRKSAPVNLCDRLLRRSTVGEGDHFGYAVYAPRSQKEFDIYPHSSLEYG